VAKRILNKYSVSILIILLIRVTASAVENIYPETIDITAGYQVSHMILGLDDTLAITRTVVNNEPLAIHNLYLDDNLPSAFELISYNLTINGTAVSHYYDGPRMGGQIPQYNYFEWVIDLPGSADTLNNTLDYQDTLILQYHIICRTTGEYTLPFHTLCGNTDQTGLFSTARPFQLQVVPEVSVNDDSGLLPDKSSIVQAYPNPFNAAVVIRIATDRPINPQPWSVAIYNIQGRQIYRTDDVIGNSLLWRPDTEVAGSVYFYKIVCGNDIFWGKLTYLK
jgi:hypothetical protein